MIGFFSSVTAPWESTIKWSALHSNCWLNYVLEEARCAAKGEWKSSESRDHVEWPVLDIQARGAVVDCNLCVLMLKSIIPGIWDHSVHIIAASTQRPNVVCPEVWIMASIPFSNSVHSPLHLPINRQASWLKLHSTATSWACWTVKLWNSPIVVGYIQCAGLRR